MDSRAIFYPDLAMVVLTIIVWGRMYIERAGQLRAARIRPQAVATSAQMAAALADTRAADNFRNLFEVPVLFYLATVVAQATSQVSAVTLTLAWSFVALRVLHSAIQLTSNRVKHRFAAYVVGSVALWLLWARIGYGLLA
jgi:hypothetical protein